MTKKLFSFYWDCGRMGSLEGLFVSTQEEVDKVIGKEVYFGEVLGKHSEVYGTLSAEDLKVIEIDQSAIDQIVAVTGENISGYNPIAYYNDYLEENGYEENDEEDGDDE